MKLTAPQGVLAALTGWVAATAHPSKNPVSPVLAGLMLTASADGTLTVAGTGCQVSASARADAQVGEPGRALIPARMLTAVVHALPARQPADVALDGTRVIIAAGTVRYTLLTLPPDDYPPLPEPGPCAAEFDPRALATAVAITAAAASKDDTLPALTCVHLTLDGKGTATLAATDRYRLAVATCPYTHHGDRVPGPALIPARDLAAVTRHPGDGPARLAISADGAAAGITAGDRHVTIRLIAGEFPAWSTLIPAGHGTAVTADIAAMAAAVKRAAVVAGRNTPVRLGFRDGEALIESGTADDATLTETVPAGLDGDPITIAFNPGYLLDALTAIAATGSTAARIAMTGPARPAVITPASPAGPAGCTHVLMPVKHAG